MANKKGVKKKGARKTKRKTARKNSPRKTNPENQTIKTLSTNFVSLQKVMVEQIKKTEELNQKIGKLLDLFEHSAKKLAEREFEITQDGRDSKKVLEKLENLFEQNKVIAKGIAQSIDKNPKSFSEERRFRERQIPEEREYDRINEYEMPSNLNIPMPKRMPSPPQMNFPKPTAFSQNQNQMEIPSQQMNSQMDLSSMSNDYENSMLSKETNLNKNQN